MYGTINFQIYYISIINPHLKKVVIKTDEITYLKCDLLVVCDYLVVLNRVCYQKQLNNASQFLTVHHGTVIVKSLLKVNIILESETLFALSSMS